MTTDVSSLRAEFEKLEGALLDNLRLYSIASKAMRERIDLVAAREGWQVSDVEPPQLSADEMPQGRLGLIGALVRHMRVDRKNVLGELAHFLERTERSVVDLVWGIERGGALKTILERINGMVELLLIEEWLSLRGMFRTPSNVELFGKLHESAKETVLVAENYTHLANQVSEQGTDVLGRAVGRPLMEPTLYVLDESKGRGLVC